MGAPNGKRGFLEKAYRKIVNSDKFEVGTSLISIAAVKITQNDNPYTISAKIEGAGLVAARFNLWNAFDPKLNLKAIDFGNGIVLPKPGAEEGDIWSLPRVVSYMKQKHGWEWEQLNKI